MKSLLFVGLGAAAGVAAGATYFFDARKGGKRRRYVKSQLDRAAHATNGVVRAYYRKARTIANNFTENGPSEWVPSPQLAGALGSMLAVYSSGRRGPAGTILRFLSLGLFARALMPSNKGNSGMHQRLESRKVTPSSAAYA